MQTRTYLAFIANINAADVLATQGAQELQIVVSYIDAILERCIQVLGKSQYVTLDWVTKENNVVLIVPGKLSILWDQICIT